MNREALKPTSIDLFCECDGFSLGTQCAGWPGRLNR